MNLFERLRIARIEAEGKERERQKAQQVEAQLRLQREREQTAKDPVELARGFYKESEFPRMLRELGPLMWDVVARYPFTRVTEQRLYWNTLEDDKSVVYPKTFTAYIAPVSVGPFSRYDLFSWSPLVRSPSELGFVIEATPSGGIILHGETRQILELQQWRGNPSVQEDALDKAYSNPFVMLIQRGVYGRSAEYGGPGSASSKFGIEGRGGG